MDVEKTIAFLLEQQVRFEAGMEELRQNQAATERDAFARAGQAQIELHRERLDSMERHIETQEREFKAFLDRFDAFLRGQGNGHAT